MSLRDRPIAVWAFPFVMLALALFALIGLYAPPAFIGHFTVFVLAVFVGYYVVWSVTPALHSPLMAVMAALAGALAAPLGLAAAYATDAPAGPCIVLAAGAIFAVSALASRFWQAFAGHN